MNSFPAQWMDTVCTGNPQGVLSLYLPGAVLVPTYDPKILKGHPALLAYFRKFMSKPGLCGTIQSTFVQDLGRYKVLSGLYRFQWVENGTPQGARARYTFVLVPTQAGWRVAEHHSSEVPDA